MATVGCYAFTGSDWKELDFPLDLWLKWNVLIFDKVALVTYGYFEQPKSSKLVHRRLNDRPNDGYGYSIEAITEAQNLLDTDWKYILNVDEFVVKKPDVENLDSRLTYTVKQHHLWGSISEEIVGGASTSMLPPVQVRLHYGNCPFYKDDLSVRFRASSDSELWHTGYARNPTALSKRLTTKISNEVKEGINNNYGLTRFLERPFDYGRYREMFPNSQLIPVNPKDLPRILLDNRTRFQWWKNEGVPPSLHPISP